MNILRTFMRQLSAEMTGLSYRSGEQEVNYVHATCPLLGPLTEGSRFQMSIIYIRNVNVALSNLRNAHIILSILRNVHVPWHYLFKSHVAGH